MNCHEAITTHLSPRLLLLGQAGYEGTRPARRTIVALRRHRRVSVQVQPQCMQECRVCRLSLHKPIQKVFSIEDLCHTLLHEKLNREWKQK